MELKPHILIVDDDPVVLDSTVMIARELGYQVSGCLEGQAALEHVRNISVDAVLADINMPQISGIDLLREIHALEPTMPVVLMSGQAELDTAVAAMQLGASDLLVKPYRTAQLDHALKRAVDLQRFNRLEQHYKKSLEQTVEQRTRELSEAMDLVKVASQEIIQRLTIASEYRDDDTGTHIRRIGLFSERLAK